MDKDVTQISKFLSLVLRHKPEIIGIELDQSGWTDVKVLIENLNAYGMDVDEALLHIVVADNSKKRFAFNETGEKIRASQGHSATVDLGYASQQPPALLYHGTSVKSSESIKSSGINKGTRQHVHLSQDIETAIQVGQRHGKAYVFEIEAAQMYKEGFAFYLSDNNVWLTDNVPAKYLKIAEGFKKSGNETI